MPPELRARRVMTRLLGLVGEHRLAGVEPRMVELSTEDERTLFDHAEPIFGRAGAEATSAGVDAWRAFLRARFQSTMQLTLTFDAPETRVT